MSLNQWPLDANQVIQSVYDTTQNALRVNTQATVTAGALEVAIDATTDSIKIGDGIDFLAINADGSINVNTVLNESTDSILIYGWNGSNNQKIKVDSSGELQIDILSSALPLGAALALTQTDRTQKTQITDGIRDGTIKAASTATIAADTSLVIAHSPNSPLPAGTNILGSLSANQSVNVNQWGGTDTTLGQKAMSISMPVVVASDQSVIDVNDDGISKDTEANKIYSFGININMATASTNNPLILFRNPSGSGKIVKIWLIEGGTPVTNVAATFKLFATPTVTSNGSAITIGSRNIGGGASSAVSLPTSLPTISANGTELASAQVGQNSTSIILDERYATIIQANNAILITGNPSSNNRTAELTFIWKEE